MRASAGFTLVELVAVLIIIGALAVFVAPRLNTTGFSQYSFHQELLAAMRHAQKTANASSCEVRVEVDPAAEDYDYRVTYTGDGQDTCGGPTPLAKPGGSGDLTGEAPNDVDVNTNENFTFNAFGDPGRKITIALSGGRNVFVEDNTGYVHD